jgi:hypothetical protein
MSLGSTLTFQTSTASGGKTVINDAVTGVGGLTVQNDASIYLNSSSSYSGITNVAGTGSPKLFVNGSKTGTGSVSIGSTGTLGGNGTIAGSIGVSGLINPGVSGVGTLTASGDVSFTNSGLLSIDLSGTTSDNLAVGGNLTLTNTTSLLVSGGGTGVNWVIATYGGTLTGNFTSIPFGYSVDYGSRTNSQITLIAPLTGVNGDFNNDGKVDAGDYVVWRKNNNGSHKLPNDNGLGTPVGPSHYTLWRNNFGKPPGSGTGELNGGAAVPEPTAMLLFFLGFIGLSTARIRR